MQFNSQFNSGADGDALYRADPDTARILNRIDRAADATDPRDADADYADMLARCLADPN